MPAQFRNGKYYGANNQINDTQTSENTTWSSEKINTEIVNTRVVQTMLTTEDLNDVKTPGLYQQESSSQATVARHYPSGNAGILEIFDQGIDSTQNHIIIQIYRPSWSAITVNYYIRRYYTGVWSSWYSSDWVNILSINTGTIPATGLSIPLPLSVSDSWRDARITRYGNKLYTQSGFTYAETTDYRTHRFYMAGGTAAAGGGFFEIKWTKSSSTTTAMLYYYAANASSASALQHNDTIVIQAKMGKIFSGFYI